MTIKSGEKEKRTNIGKNKQEKAHFQYHDTTFVVNLYTKFEAPILNSCGDIFDEKSGEKEKKKNKHREEQKGEGPFSIPRYNLSL